MECAICLICIGNKREGHGCLIGSKYLMTSFHVVMKPDDNVFGRYCIRAQTFSIMFSDNEQRELSVDRLVYPKLDQATTSLELDIAVFELDDPKPVDTYFKLQDFTEKKFMAPYYSRKQSVFTIIYDDFKKTCLISGKICCFKDWGLFYDIRTRKGYSGAPIFLDDCTLVGVHRLGGESFQISPTDYQPFYNAGVRTDLFVRDVCNKRRNKKWFNAYNQSLTEDHMEDE